METTTTTNKCGTQFADLLTKEKLTFGIKLIVSFTSSMIRLKIEFGVIYYMKKKKDMFLIKL